MSAARKKRSGLPAARESRQRIQLRIEALNDSGAGFAYHNDHKIAVEKTLPGELVEIEYAPDRPRKKRIRLLNILETVPERQTPPCEYFSRCGGCHLQHFDYPAQLTFKQQVFEQLIAAETSLPDITVHPVVGMPEPFYYRNKSQMPFQQRQGEAVFGLYRSRSHEVIAIDQCRVETREANQILQIVRDWANRYQVPIYDEKSGKGVLRHVMIRRSMFTNQIMIVLVVTRKSVPDWQPLLQQLKTTIPTLKSMQLNINSRQTNVILGEKNIVVWGDAYIEEKLGKYKYRVYPHTFFQVNSVQMVRMLEKMRQIAGFRTDDRVADVYCGVGAISFQLAEMVREVTGIEAVEASIRAAVQNMADNDITNVNFISGDAARTFRKLRKDGEKFDGIVIDPPRKGVEKLLIEEISYAEPENVVYISCNPKTLIRDLVHFQELGYTCREIFPFDMFPQTHHVEALTVLRRKH